MLQKSYRFAGDLTFLVSGNDPNTLSIPNSNRVRALNIHVAPGVQVQAEKVQSVADAGARTVAQDEATCVVYGMPKEAVAHGGAECVLPLGLIGARLLSLA